MSIDSSDIDPRTCTVQSSNLSSLREGDLLNNRRLVQASPCRGGTTVLTKEHFVCRWVPNDSFVEQRVRSTFRKQRERRIGSNDFVESIVVDVERLRGCLCEGETWGEEDLEMVSASWPSDVSLRLTLEPLNSEGGGTLFKTRELRGLMTCAWVGTWHIA